MKTKKNWKGKLVCHRKNGKLGLVVKASEIHPGFWNVMTAGKIEEWHIISFLER